MISATWLQKRRPYWERLEDLLKQAQTRGLRRLSHPELRELSLLYRQTAADLSAVRVDGASGQYSRYLNNLLALAHNITYSGARARASEMFVFFRRTFPVTFRRNFHLIALGFGIFAVTALFAALLTWYVPDFKMYILGPGMIRTIEQKKMWTDSIVGLEPAVSSGIMTHNLSVTFATFAGGITFGIFTVYSLVINGLLIGTIGTACAMGGMSVPLWSFVASHGSLELPSIFIAAGAGLRIAQGMLAPGYMTRRASLVNAGRDAMVLIVGCIPLLIVAGILEGFVSPRPNIPVAAKFALGGALFTALVMWLSSGWTSEWTKKAERAVASGEKASAAAA
jgi:uncharacterized membrane protein SpoIIM required for sporulation